MTIPLIREPADMAQMFGATECCHFCHTPTTYWHENTNNPVCPTCSKSHYVKELPDYGQNIRKAKRAKTLA